MFEKVDRPGLSQDYTNLDDQLSQTCHDSPRFKPFTLRKKCLIIDIAVPGDARVKVKEPEKVEKYPDLKTEICNVWNMKAVTVTPVVVGALGAVSKDLDKWIEKIGIERQSLYQISRS